MKQLLLIAITVCAATSHAETAIQSAPLQNTAIKVMSTRKITTQDGQSINATNTAGAVTASNVVTIKGAPAHGSHCVVGSGVVSADANGRLMQCFDTAKGDQGTWQYVAESDSGRIAEKLDQLNVTNMQILAKLSELTALQQASAHK